MRKYISLILLIIILFASNGYYLYFKYLQNNIQQEIKHEIRKGLNEKDLTLIIVTSNNEKEILWTKENKEFKYKNAMYDIVKLKIQNGNKYYYCINDIKEKKLIAKFSKSNRRRNKTLVNLKKLIGNKYISQKKSLNSQIAKSEISFSEYQKNYKSRDLDAVYPPPKFNFYL